MKKRQKEKIGSHWIPFHTIMRFIQYDLIKAFNFDNSCMIDRFECGVDIDAAVKHFQKKNFFSEFSRIARRRKNFDTVNYYRSWSVDLNEFQ